MKRPIYNFFTTWSTGVAALLLAGLISPSLLYAQDSYEENRNRLLNQQSSTRSQIENIDRQIETISRRLSERSTEFNEVFAQFEEVERLVNLQEERLRQLNREQGHLAEEIRLIEQNLAELQRQLDELIERYKETLIYLYKNGRTTELALLLTSGSFNQLLIRSYYLQQFNDFLESQMESIYAMQEQYNRSRDDLRQTRSRNEEVLVTIRNETEALEKQRDQQKRLVDNLRGDITNLENQKRQQEQERQNLENAMSRLIAEEQRLRRAAATGDRASVPAEFVTAVSDDQLAFFSERFRERKGQLPWPVESGVITQKFGERIHPVFNTRTSNLGIDISALAASPVRVVSDGYVYAVQPLQGYGDMIFVNHGSYITAYGNLSDIYVRRNQVLQSGDVIGLSGNEDSIRGSVLYFVVREGSQIVNPESWLQRANP
ncbi:MAG TPA: peptidoglycan DD-metalloendopeptidase family protein [Balneolaceae bacterium]|nr:peptidoglycan DD-metalloendopeptidase family protein [Balneolaceae bacterium]